MALSQCTTILAPLVLTLIRTPARASAQALLTKELDGAPLLVVANKKDLAGANAASAVAHAFGKLVDDRPDRPARVIGVRPPCRWGTDACD